MVNPGNVAGGNVSKVGSAGSWTEAFSVTTPVMVMSLSLVAFRPLRFFRTGHSRPVLPSGEWMGGLGHQRRSPWR